MKPGKKTPPPPASGSMEDLMSALKEADSDIKKRKAKDAKRRTGPGPLAGLPGILKIVAVVVIVALLGLIFDGVRREGGEMSATLAEVSGQVTVAKGGQGAGSPGALKMELGNKDVITTGSDGSATVVFPDGSSVQVEPKTRFEVRLLDFARGEVRDRSFMVHSGAVVSRVSKAFGAKSSATVCTPTAVAAARGTGFRVYYDPAKKETYVGVVDGTVNFKTSAGAVDTPTGQLVAASGFQLSRTQAMSAGQTSRISTGFSTLGQHEKPQNWLTKLEYAINTFFDPLLQLLGVAPGGWGYQASYAARRSTCQEALRRLQQHMVSLQDEQIPEFVSLVTLDELGVDAQLKPRILDQFAGNMIDSYRKTGVGAYEIVARARDKDKTPYRLTPSGIQEIKEGG
jgi:hypothetical protein